MNSLFMDYHLLPHPQCPSPAPKSPLLAAITSLSSSQLTQLGVDNSNLVISQRFPGQSGDFLPLIDQSVSVRGQQLLPWHGQQFSLQLVQQQGFLADGQIFLDLPTCLHLFFVDISSAIGKGR